MKFEIRDWVNNLPFGTLEFDTFDDAWDHIWTNVDTDTDGVLDEYFVVSK